MRGERALLGALWSAFLGLWGRARVGPGEKRPPALERRARLVLTPHHTVHVVAVGRKTLVVGCSGQGFHVLSELDEAAGPAPEHSAGVWR